MPNCRHPSRSPLSLLRPAWALVLAAGLLPAAAGGKDLPPDPRQAGLAPAQRLDALLERIRIEQRSVETMEAEFEQRRESGMLIEPAVTSGVFSYAEPDRVRWEYAPPESISTVIDGEEMTTWYRDLGQVEILQVGRQSKLVLEYLAAGSNIDRLLEYFTVSLTLPSDPARPYTLHLTPRPGRIAKRLRELSLWVDPESFLVSRLRFVEADGDVTDLRFSNVKVNAELPGDRFDLAIPEGVAVRSLGTPSRAGLR